MQILSLSQQLIPLLEDFLRDHAKHDPDGFFFPHRSDFATLANLVQTANKDVYSLGVYNDKVVTYGLLRGWDEGYAIPSLGVAVAGEMQGLGLGRAMMHWLHASAAVRGAKKIRLRVNCANMNAIALYESMGYFFVSDPRDPEYMVGVNELKVKR